MSSWGASHSKQAKEQGKSRKQARQIKDQAARGATPTALKTRPGRAR
jgi:hypothetical protein